MIRVDLHMHSWHSDGKQSCQALVDELISKGIHLFALTDHDTISGLTEMSTAVLKTDLLFVPGVEVACTYQGREYHLTTYGYDPNHSAFKKALVDNLEIRKRFDQEIMAAVSKDYDVSLEDFLAYEDDPKLGGWPSLNFLIRQGIIEDIGDYFRITKVYDLKMIFPSPEEIIPILKDAGAKVFLAHPSSNQAGGLSIERLDHFRLSGIDGLECYSPYTQDPDEIQYYLSYCKKHNLMISGGSDYHGGFVQRKMGQPQVTADMVSHWFYETAISRRRG